MSERKFKFRTMGQYIRNIVDPISVSLVSRINGVERNTNKRLLALEDELNRRLAELDTVVEQLRGRR